MAPEPEPGRGQSGRGAANVAAGFKVDDSSLRKLNEQWRMLVSYVKQFNAELAKIKPDRLAALSAGMHGSIGGGRAGLGGGTISSSPFTVLPGAAGGVTGQWSRQGGLYLPTGAGGGATPPAAPAAVGQPAGGGGSTITRSSFTKIGLGVAAGAFGAAVGYGSSHRQNMVDAERLAQYTAWGTSQYGNIGTTMTQARHFWFGGDGQQGLTGGTGTQDYLGGLQTLNANQGLLNMGARSQALQLSAGRIGNLLGSYQQGANAAAGLYSARTTNALMGIGVTSIGIGGVRSSPEKIAQQVLMRVYGRMPTEIEVAEGMQDGAPLRVTLDSLGLDQDVQDFISRYGMVSDQMKNRNGGRTPSTSEVSRELSNTGGTTAAGKAVLGGTVYDADRRKAQKQAELEQQIADTALPALERSANAAAKALGGVANAANGPLGALLGGATGYGSGVAGPLNAAMGFGGGLLQNMLLLRMMHGRGGPGNPGGLLGRLGAGAGGSALLRGAGLAGAGAIGGAVVNSVVGGSSHSARDVTGDVLGGAATGAGIGAMVGTLTGPGSVVTVPVGAAAGGLIGGAIGGLSNLFGEAGEDDGGNYASGTRVGAHPEIAAAAEKYLGVPYVWGGKSPKGMDCSGLVYLAIKDATGAKAPLNSSGQSTWSGFTQIERSQVSAGDILWWPGHVVVATSNTMCISAPHPGAVVKRTAIRYAGPKPGEPSKCLRFNGLGAKSTPGSPATPGQTATDTTSAPTAPGAGPSSAGAFAATSARAPGQEEVDVIAAAIGRSGVSARTTMTSAVAGATGSSNTSTGSTTQASRSGGSQDNTPTGSGVQRWSPIVSKVLAQLGMPADWQDEVLHRIDQESSGRPEIVNKWDVNWKNGHPSVGLMQVIQGTFNEYAGPYKSVGPKNYGVSMDPTANIYAGLNYAQHRYGRGRVPQIMMRPGGYASGAYDVSSDQIALVHQGEMILPKRSARQVRDYIKRQEESVSTLSSHTATRGGRGNVTVHLSMPIQMAPGASLADAERLVSMIARKLESDERIAAVGSGD